MKKVLVTGSSGILGKSIVELLRSKDYYVIGIDLLNGETTDVVIDIKDQNAVKSITEGFDAIIHTAALHGKHIDLNYSRDAFIRNNIMATNNLLLSSVENGIKKFVYTSSTSVYGSAMVNDRQAVWVDEKLNPEPRDIYDISKLSCELLCEDYFKKDGIETTVLRVSRFLPEDDNTKANNRLHRGLDVRDGALAHQLVIEQKFNSFEIYNISSDSSFTKADLVQLYSNPINVINRYFPEAEKFFLNKKWHFNTRIDRVYSIEKAKRELNYRPVYNFDTLIMK